MKARMTARKKDATGDSSTFEETLRRLEKIVATLEEGDVPLEEAMRLYEEGIAAAKACARRLSQAELALKRLTKDAEGNFTLMDEKE
jgi:exodeoxyribonuclease VII small subunit